MQPTIDDLLREYRAAAAIHAKPPDAKRANEAATRMVVLSREIAAAGPVAVATFAKFVSADDPHLALWAAHHLLDFMEPDDQARAQALGVIESAKDTGWLENWKAERQDE